VTIQTEEEREAALQQWLSNFKAGHFKKNQPPNDVAKVAVALGVDPPPLPLSPEGQRNLELISEQPLRGTAGHEERPLDEPEEASLTSTRRRILALMAWAKDQEWPGKSGATDLYAYLAFLQVAYETNKTYVGMSQYQLAELVGISNKTAWLSMRRLERRGLIKRDEQNDVTPSIEPRADRYFLGSPNLLRNYVSPSDTIPLNCKDSRTFATLVPDLFKTRKGLSKTTLRVYDALDLVQAQKAADLARKLKRHRSNVGNALKQLAAFDLATKTEDGWLKLLADLEALAEVQGTAAAMERNRAYYGTLREGYRTYLQERNGGNAEGVPEARIQAREGTLVSTTGTADRTDGGAALPERDTQPIPNHHGQRIPVEQGQGVGRDPARVLPDHGTKQPIGGMAMGYGAEEREAACVGCGQVHTFSAPDLTPYSCAHCKARFEFVDELAALAS
jgi:predicted transcriptional regulator